MNKLECLGGFVVKPDTYLHVTHTDADGVMCAVVALWLKYVPDVDDVIYESKNTKDKELYLKYAISNILFAEPGNIVEEIILRIMTYKYIPEFITVTDLSFRREDINFINELESKGVQFDLYDHHKTALWMKDFYSWATVETDKGSAAKILFDLRKEINQGSNEISYYIEEVSNYDTWKWKEENDILAEYPSLLLNSVGKEFFIKLMINYFIHVDKADLMYGDIELAMIYNQQSKREQKVKKIKESGKCIKFHELDNVFISFGDINPSFIAEKIYTNDIRIFGLIDLSDKSMNLRTCNPSIDLGEFCKKYGITGGGHPGAAGMKLSDDDFEYIILKVFSSKEGE